MSAAAFAVACALPGSTPASRSAAPQPSAASLALASSALTPSFLTPSAPVSVAVAASNPQHPTSNWLVLSPLPGERTPLRTANSMIEHHSALGVTPFDDPVSATMVSYFSTHPRP